MRGPGSDWEAAFCFPNILVHERGMHGAASWGSRCSVIIGQSTPHRVTSSSYPQDLSPLLFPARSQSIFLDQSCRQTWRSPQKRK